jgi:hypothetical protein
MEKMAKYFKTSLGQYELVETADGSWSIKSEYFDEESHSNAGALGETRYNFIEGCEIPSLKSPSKVFEVGFATGLGAKVCFENSSVPLEFISSEIDPELITWAVKEGSYSDFFKNFDLLGEFRWKHNSNPWELRVLPGDVRETIQSINVNVQAIFQDAYSPKKNPTLWTKEWFAQLASIADKDCILATYSSSAGIRKALAVSGWHLKNREGFGRKRTMTLAKKSPWQQDDITEEYRNAKIEPKSDQE